uniref:Knottin scorpion toxin-like domain-containing protein n=1 Tax=Strigamia maritima TaxID=126957 RepID=T1IK25_STRMM
MQETIVILTTVNIFAHLILANACLPRINNPKCFESYAEHLKCRKWCLDNGNMVVYNGHCDLDKKRCVCDN